jgi:transglutaminase-like putative cysteine protease
MKFSIRHQTRYIYSEPVYLEPHVLRLFPRACGPQRVTSFQLSIDPRPVVVTESLDAANNGVHQAWFEDPARELSITSSFEAETLRGNPYDFLLSELSMATLPVVYPETESATLAPYCSPSSKDRSVYAFAKAVAQEVEWQTIPFLSALNRKLHNHCEHGIREEGEAKQPEATLADRSGACRDLAVVFIEACRSMGIAARFVSGYELVAAREKTYMHAWAEVYLPGGGWRGYDPSRGLAAAERHLAVAAGLTPAMAAPVTGSFRGTGAMSRMEFNIQVQTAAGIFAD